MNAKMLFSTMFSAFTLMNGACSPDPAGGNSASTPTPDLQPAGSRALVVWFSCTETTTGIADRIAEATGAVAWRIMPEEVYTAEDLNYHHDSSRANREQNDSSARPAIEGRCERLADCDVVFLGYPIWWGMAPKVVYTFLENHDLTGKTVVPFCTSGSSGIGSSDTDLHRLAPGARWKPGRRFGGNESKSTIKNWIGGLALSVGTSASR